MRAHCTARSPLRAVACPGAHRRPTAARAPSRLPPAACSASVRTCSQIAHVRVQCVRISRVLLRRQRRPTVAMCSLSSPTSSQTHYLAASAARRSVSALLACPSIAASAVTRWQARACRAATPREQRRREVSRERAPRCRRHRPRATTLDSVTAIASMYACDQQTLSAAVAAVAAQSSHKQTIIASTRTFSNNSGAIIDIAVSSARADNIAVSLSSFDAVRA
jgi:hypothetical protein